jgi:hypothetical protein
VLDLPLKVPHPFDEAGVTWQSGRDAADCLRSLISGKFPRWLGGELSLFPRAKHDCTCPRSRRMRVCENWKSFIRSQLSSSSLYFRRLVWCTKRKADESEAISENTL